MKASRQHSYQRSSRCYEHGFTLVEIAIVLGIAGLIIGGIWYSVASIGENNKINTAVQELQTVSQNIIALYQGKSSLPPPCTVPYITSNMIDAGAIPGWMVGSLVEYGCKTAASPWDPNDPDFVVWWRAPGPGTLSTGTTGNQFWVSFYNIPLDACVAILLQAISCDPSQPTCPKRVYTAKNTGPAPMSPTGSPASWQNSITPAEAISTDLCGANAPFNSPSPQNNSLEFLFQP